jgi:hypothetical protein
MLFYVMLDTNPHERMRQHHWIDKPVIQFTLLGFIVVDDGSSHDPYHGVEFELRTWQRLSVKTHQSPGLWS